MIGYLVMVMSKKIATNAFPVDLETSDTYGACLVYKSKSKLKKIFGKDCDFIEIEIPENKANQ